MHAPPSQPLSLQCTCAIHPHPLHPTTINNSLARETFTTTTIIYPPNGPPRSCTHHRHLLLFNPTPAPGRTSMARVGEKERDRKGGRERERGKERWKEGGREGGRERERERHTRTLAHTHTRTQVCSTTLSRLRLILHVHKHPPPLLPLTISKPFSRSGVHGGKPNGLLR